MGKKFNVIVADPPWSFQDKLSMSDVARGALANYDTMTISQIKALPVKDLLAPDGAILALWVPSSLLQQGLDTMNAWGFSHKQTYIWVKTKINPLHEISGVFLKAWKNDKKPLGKYNDKTWKAALHNVTQLINVIDYQKAGEFLNKMLAFGMGRLFRQTHEICLVGTSNNKIYKQLKNKSQRSVSLAPNLKHSAKPEHLQDSLDIMFPKGNKLEIFARRVRPNWNCVGNEICNGEDITVSLAKL